jgi:hypothetical protein
MCLSLLSNGSDGNLRILPGWDKLTKNPLRSCALAIEHCITAIEE